MAMERRGRREGERGGGVMVIFLACNPLYFVGTESCFIENSCDKTILKVIRKQHTMSKIAAWYWICLLYKYLMKWYLLGLVPRLSTHISPRIVKSLGTRPVSTFLAESSHRSLATCKANAYKKLIYKLLYLKQYLLLINHEKTSY